MIGVMELRRPVERIVDPMTQIGRWLVEGMRKQPPEMARWRDLTQDESIIGPILVGATVQLSLFRWQNDPGTWYIDTRPRNGKPVRRFSERVPSDFKGLKDEVFEVPVAAAAVLKLNERYAGEV